MDKMVEAVARALHKQSAEINMALGVTVPPYEHDRAGFYLDMARTAILETLRQIREPGEGVEIAGDSVGVDHKCRGDGGNWHDWQEHDPMEVWQAMIDHLMTETGDD